MRKAFPFFLQQMISERFDVIFQMQGNGSIVNPMIELFGAKHTAGFCLKDDYCPNRTHYLEYPDGYHEVERHLKLMEFLGIDSRGTDLEFPILQEDYAELRAKGLDLPPGRYVCVHAGSRGGYRQWPPEYFAALADHCAGQDLQVVLTGTSDELPIIEKVIRHMEHEPVIAAGKTSLGAVAALIGNAFGLISNCTGVSHIAAALKTPSVVISMDGEPNRWAPMNKTIHYTVDWTKTPEFNLALDELKKLFLLRPKGEHFRDGGVTTRENLMQSP